MAFTENLEAAASHLLLAENQIDLAIRGGVADALNDGPYWRLMLNTVRSARQFVAESRDALQPHVFKGRGLGLEEDADEPR